MLVQQNKSEGAKNDTGKPRPSLVPTKAILGIAEAREYGIRKYGEEENWRLIEVRRLIDAAYRHMLAMIDDHQSLDTESGLAHYKHLACNAAFICALLAEDAERSMRREEGP